MGRKTNTNSTSLVSVYERPLKGDRVRFYLLYSLNGKQKKEPLKKIPIVNQSDNKAYKESQAIAKKYATMRMEEIRNGMLGFSNRQDMLLSDWFTVCVKRTKVTEREEGNHHKWSETIRYTGELVEQYRVKTKLGEVNKAFVLGFIDFLKNVYVIPPNRPNSGQHLKPSTIDKKLKTFSHVLNLAVSDGKIVRNPFDQLSSSEKIHVPPSERKFLVEEQLKSLAATPMKDEATRQVYFFMCFCGMRISDVKALKWGDIEIDGNRWRIRKRQQKTQTPVYLPLSEQAKKFIPERGDKTDDDLVFDNLYSEQTMNRHLNDWAKAAGINKKVTLHTGRHTFATLSFTRGADIYTTSKLLGHSDIRTTQIYADIVDQKKMEVVDLLNDIL